GLYVVHIEQFSDLPNFLSTQAIYDPGFPLVCLDKFDKLLFGLVLGPYLIIQVLTVERRLEDISSFHLQVLLDIELHFRCSSSRKGYDGKVADLANNRFDFSVFWPEVMPPLRNTMCLIYGYERYVGLLQE